VVISVRTQRNRISADGKYLEDHHEPIAARRLNVMQLGAIVSSLQHVGLHDPNKLLVDYNLAIMI
jgi:hypothetical protein